LNFELKYWHLSNHQLFKQLNKNEINQLGVLTNLTTAYKDEIIYLDNSVKKIFIIAKGVIKIINTTNDDQENVIEVLQDGDMFGAIFLTDTPSTSEEKAIVASTQVNLISFLAKDFEALLQQKSNLGISYTKWMGWRLNQVNNKYKNLIYKDVKTRLMDFLEEFASKSNTSQQNTLSFKNVLSQKDYADLIGSNRQAVSNLFAELEKSGYLSYNRREITILKPRVQTK
jgi:CRP/FNR family transcriptional regulator, cyclic AMP receptor protein